MVKCIRTSSEPERDVDGLVTHFAKHLSFVFCVEFGKEERGGLKTPHYNMFFLARGKSTNVDEFLGVREREFIANGGHYRLLACVEIWRRRHVGE